jgi:hypothetical protein
MNLIRLKHYLPNSKNIMEKDFDVMNNFCSWKFIMFET